MSVTKQKIKDGIADAADAAKVAGKKAVDKVADVAETVGVDVGYLDVELLQIPSDRRYVSGTWREVGCELANRQEPVKQAVEFEGLDSLEAEMSRLLGRES